jgi:hypothetical protein
MRTAIALLATLVLVGCSADAGDATAQASQPSASVASTAPSATTTSPSTTTTVAVTTTSSTTTTTSVPAPTTTDLRTTAVAVAQKLATAYADGDWVLARSISPEPNYTDAELEAGYAGLEASTLFLGDMTESADRIQMWLLMVAHEIDSGRERTSLYCIQWDYVPASNTIDKISGELINRLDGFVPPGDSERGALVCSPDFDTVNSAPASPAPTSPTTPDLPPLEPSPGFDPRSCTFDGHPLFGPVVFVSNSYAADVQVYETNSWRPDLRVTIVRDFYLADQCGEWAVLSIDPTGEATRVYFTSVAEFADLRVVVSGR